MHAGVTIPRHTNGEEGGGIGNDSDEGLTGTMLKEIPEESVTHALTGFMYTCTTGRINLLRCRL